MRNTDSKKQQGWFIFYHCDLYPETAFGDPIQRKQELSNTHQIFRERKTAYQYGQCQEINLLV